MTQTPMHEAMRAARMEAGLTQKQLAETAGVHQNVISTYEKGKCAPSLYNIAALADALGLTIDEYVGHRVKDRSVFPGGEW